VQLSAFKLRKTKMNEFTTTYGGSAAEAAPAQRAQFIRKTYMLLAAAVLAFIAVELFLFMTPAATTIASVIFSGGSIGWLIVLGLFMGVSFLANRWATSETSVATQYIGLGIFVVAEAVIFVPLIMMAMYYSGDGSVLLKAGVVALGLFLGITATVFITRTDFSFLGPILAISGFVALGFIVASLLFGFSLGTFFAFVMVAFAGTAILYQTSNVLHRFNTNQHVAAALVLFAAMALLFWYILSIFSRR
jgi:FtsH-binding integral membrane protein